MRYSLKNKERKTLSVGIVVKFFESLRELKKHKEEGCDSDFRCDECEKCFKDETKLQDHTEKCLKNFCFV